MIYSPISYIFSWRGHWLAVAYHLQTRICQFAHILRDLRRKYLLDRLTLRSGIFDRKHHFWPASQSNWTEMVHVPPGCALHCKYTQKLTFFSFITKFSKFSPLILDNVVSNLLCPRLHLSLCSSVFGRNHGRRKLCGGANIYQWNRRSEVSFEVFQFFKLFTVINL